MKEFIKDFWWLIWTMICSIIVAMFGIFGSWYSDSMFAKIFITIISSILLFMVGAITSFVIIISKGEELF